MTLNELFTNEILIFPSGVYDSDPDSDDSETREIHSLATQIRTKKKLMKNEQRLNNTKKPTLPRNTEPKQRERSVGR